MLAVEILVREAIHVLKELPERSGAIYKGQLSGIRSRLRCRVSASSGEGNNFAGDFVAYELCGR